VAGAARELVLASGNAGKLREFESLLDAGGAWLGGLELRLSGLAEVGPIALPQEGASYEPNAIAKARTVADATGRIALADDSGLEVDALGGAPGPLSARYGGPGLDDAGRVAKLLGALEGADRRTARFVCVAALAHPDGRIRVARGVCEGAILSAPRGRGGFGYDPVFEPAGRGLAMAELPASEKNRLSHRARAIALLRPTLVDWLG
jgi:XTP/dITP diphosphohydrolase